MKRKVLIINTLSLEGKCFNKFIKLFEKILKKKKYYIQVGVIASRDIRIQSCVLRVAGAFGCWMPESYMKQEFSTCPNDIESFLGQITKDGQCSRVIGLVHYKPNEIESIFRKLGMDFSIKSFKGISFYVGRELS